MRIFAEISSHDSSGTSPGGRIVRVDSIPEEGDSTAVNGQFVFDIPEGVAVSVDSDSFFSPQTDPESIPARTASELLVRYPMYDHVLYNFYLDTDDLSNIDISTGLSYPSTGNTTPTLPTTYVAPSVPRCQVGRASGPGAVGMVPNSLALLPVSEARTTPVYGCVMTALLDLWAYNPCYIDVDSVSVPVGNTVDIGGVSLTSVAGARTSGSNDFDGSLATPTLVAADMVAAINDPANGFATFVEATVDPTTTSRVQLRPVPSSNTNVTVTTASASLTAVESHPGTDTLMVWWNVSLGDTSEDQGYAELGPGAGLNSPAIKSIVETNPETTDLLVYVSVDDGVTWFQANYLEPVDVLDAGTDLRICFINVGSDKLYLHGFCVLFPDLPAPL